MTRLQSIFILVPGIVGLLWLFAYLFIAPRNVFFRKLKRFVALLAFFFVFAHLSSNAGSRMMLHFVLLEQVCALALVPCFISFIKEYGNSKAPGLLFKLCCMLPMIHLVIGIESVYVAGFEDSLRIYTESLLFHGPMFPYLNDNAQMVVYATYTYMFKAFLLMNFFMFAINLMTCCVNRFKFRETFSFLIGDCEANPVPVLYFLFLIVLLCSVPVLILGKSCYEGFVLITVLACILLSVDVFMFSLAGLGGPAEMLSLKGILKSVREKTSQE